MFFGKICSFFPSQLVSIIVEEKVEFVVLGLILEILGVSPVGALDLLALDFVLPGCLVTFFPDCLAHNFSVFPLLSE